MKKEEIIKIATNMLNQENIVLAHGTSIENAKSILESGLNGHRTTYIIFSPTDKPEDLATYGWKDNEPGNAANVVGVIPGTFFEQLLGLEKEDVILRLETERKRNGINSVIRSLCEFTVEIPEEKKTIDEAIKPNFNIPIIPTVSFSLPREFIKGMFVYQNKTNYLTFTEGGKFQYDEALSNLTYFENPYFFDHLPIEEQAKFVQKISTCLGLNENIERK